MPSSPEKQVETKFVLREVTRERKKPLWFRMMTAIGPCTTDDPGERAEYQTREHALAAPCWSHMLTCWEIEEVPDAS
jgi:3-deoxy-D-arabino-heptulosonate 7-phosphate (DAHP) synthase